MLNASASPAPRFFSSSSAVSTSPTSSSVSSQRKQYQHSNLMDFFPPSLDSSSSGVGGGDEFSFPSFVQPTTTQQQQQQQLSGASSSSASGGSSSSSSSSQLDHLTLPDIVRDLSVPGRWGSDSHLGVPMSLDFNGMLSPPRFSSQQYQYQQQQQQQQYDLLPSPHVSLGGGNGAVMAMKTEPFDEDVIAAARAAVADTTSSSASSAFSMSSSSPRTPVSPLTVSDASATSESKIHHHHQQQQLQLHDHRSSHATTHHEVTPEPGVTCIINIGTSDAPLLPAYSKKGNGGVKGSTFNKRDSLVEFTVLYVCDAQQRNASSSSSISSLSPSADNASSSTHTDGEEDPRVHVTVRRVHVQSDESKFPTTTSMPASLRTKEKQAGGGYLYTYQIDMNRAQSKKVFRQTNMPQRNRCNEYVMVIHVYNRFNLIGKASQPFELKGRDRPDRRSKRSEARGPQRKVVQERARAQHVLNTMPFAEVVASFGSRRSSDDSDDQSRSMDEDMSEVYASGTSLVEGVDRLRNVMSDVDASTDAEQVRSLLNQFVDNTTAFVRQLQNNPNARQMVSAALQSQEQFLQGLSTASSSIRKAVSSDMQRSDDDSPLLSRSKLLSFYRSFGQLVRLVNPSSVSGDDEDDDVDEHSELSIAANDDEEQEEQEQEQEEKSA